MKYLCLIYLDEHRMSELADEDCVDYDAAIRGSGLCIASEALQPVHTATTVTVRDGKVLIYAADEIQPQKFSGMNTHVSYWVIE